MAIDIRVQINGVEQADIQRSSIRKNDQRNQKTDTLMFEIWDTDGASLPKLNDDVQMFDGITKTFGGVVTKINIESDSEKYNAYKIEVEDYVHLLDRKVFVERFVDMTVGEIITQLRDKYAQGFGVVNVDCLIVVKSITFSNQHFSEALEKLARLTNYSWYVDYEKDIHFFDVGQELAPFDIVSGNGNYIIGSLKIERDISQLRNRVKVRGGEAEGNEQTLEFDGTDARTIQNNGVAFDLTYKFANQPIVSVAGVAQTVGTEYLSDEESFDCFWSFQEKYIRFKESTVPADTATLLVTGTPLFPVLVQKSESNSINEYGVWEFYKEDKAIKTREDALKRAQAELEAYGASINEGSFRTYKKGFRSGQRITVNALGVNETFIIQRVSFRMPTNTRGEWKVELASLQNIDIIRFLQYLLEKSGNEVEGADSDNLLTFQQYNEAITMNENLSDGTVTQAPYYWADDQTVNPIIWGEFTWS